MTCHSSWKGGRYLQETIPLGFYQCQLIAEKVVFQFCDRHMRNVLMDEQHYPATMDISVFSIYTIWASFREEFWSCNRTVDFGFLDSYNIWLMKVKESLQFQFFSSYAIDIRANELQPTNKAAFICTTRWRLTFLFFFFFLLEEQTYFSFQVHLFTKEGIRKFEEFAFRANPCTICIVHSFILSFCSEWAFIMDLHITTVTLNCFVTL